MSSEPLGSECQRLRRIASDYVDGHVSRRTRPSIESHLEGCPSCVTFVDELRHTISLLCELREALPARRQELEVARLFADYFPEPETPSEISDWTQVKELWGELAQLSADVRLKTIQKDARYLNEHLCDWLIIRARRVSSSDPERGVPIATAAVGIARLRATRSGDSKRLIRALEALSWCFVHLRDFSKATIVLSELGELCSSSNVKPEERALYLSIKGMFFSHTGRLQEGVECLERALEIGGHTGDRKGRLCELVNLAGALLNAGNTERALELLREAKDLTEGEQDPPRLQRVIYSNLVLALCEAGQTSEAKRLLPRVRVLGDAVGGWYPRLYEVWLEGTLARAEGRNEDATRIFQRVRGEFLRRGHVVWHVEATLDLARTYLALGQLGDLEHLSRELVETIEAAGGDSRVWFAVVSLAQAIRQRSLTEQAIRSIGIALSSVRMGQRFRE